LLACALPGSHVNAGVRVRSALNGSLDWSKLGKLAGYHRVKPLLYKRLAEHADESVPESVMRELAIDFRAGATQNLHLIGELIMLARAFALAGIEVLPHKGPLLARIAYGDLALRTFEDLDLLVHAADLPQAIAVLSEMGYRPPPELAWLSPSALLRWTGEMSYSSSRGTSVDLHWRLTPSHYTVQLDPAILWRSCASIKVAGTELVSLAPEALLLLLAVHGAKHCWEAIGWLADVAWLLDAHADLDWRQVMELAEESHCERPLLLAASLVQRLFESPVPAWVGEAAQGDRNVRRLHRRVVTRWYDRPPEPPHSPELYSFATALARRPQDSLNHLAGLLLHPTEAEWKSGQLRDGWLWWYLPRRIGRLFRKYVIRTIKS